MFNKSFIIFSLLAIFLSCKQQNTEKATSNEIADSVSYDSTQTYSSVEDIQIWAFSEMGDTIIKIRSVPIESLSPKKLIELLNSKYGPSVSLEFDKISNDTVYVRIPNSTVLTQQMGSHGAYDYMITSTFTLTELKDIDYVNFSFELGDHAVPGVYSRHYFLKELKQIKAMNSAL